MTTKDLTGSNLLDALAGPDQNLLADHAETMRLSAGHILYHPGDDVRYAYFPRASALASFHVMTGEGSAVEVAVVGREGAVGGIVSEGNIGAYARSCVMHGGEFYRISCADLEKVKSQSRTMRSLFSRYADCLLAQIFQSVACNAAHTIEQRAAKWIIAAADRTGENSIAITQEQLGSLLGVGRSYVSRVLRRMKQSEAIETRRQAIVIRNRKGLEKTSCDCNRLVIQHFEAVMKGIYPRQKIGLFR